MDSRSYKKIYSELSSPGDVERIHASRRLPKDLLKVILTQKIIRDTRKRYHTVFARSPSLRRKWTRGKSFLELAEELQFPPVLTASIILQGDGVTRNQFRRYLKSPDAVECPRTRRELREVLKSDFVYSPNAMASQRRRGHRVEERVREWLTSLGLGFLTEDDAKSNGNTGKTPDFLLDKSFKSDFGALNWIECKASFGDRAEFRRDHRKQFKHYVELFGPGLVVYWYGFLDGIGQDGVSIASREFFRGET